MRAWRGCTAARVPRAIDELSNFGQDVYDILPHSDDARMRACQEGRQTEVGAVDLYVCTRVHKAGLVV